jgi:hypothetical protein
VFGMNELFQNNMHPIQVAADCILRYRTCSFGAEWDKLYVGRIIDAFSSAFVSKIMNKP